MKQLRNSLLLLLLLTPLFSLAQVTKQVEVTKAYVPQVERATKHAIEPDMTDTVRMRPDIDYTITPLSLQTTLTTTPIRPAQVTYWEFNRSKPLYLKLGAGYPTNSVADLYLSTQNPSTGYLMAYINHEGRYADRINDFDGKKYTAWQLENRVGVAGGKYLGRRILEADIRYDNHWYHRFGAAPSSEYPVDLPNKEMDMDKPGSRLYFDEMSAQVRLGDDFLDLSRFNFEVVLHGGLFSGKPQCYRYDTAEQAYKPYNASTRQMMWGASARIAKGFGRHHFSLSVGYDHLSGSKLLKGCRQQQLRAGVRYGVTGGVVKMDLGADLLCDWVKGVETQIYILPHLHLDFHLGTQGLRPFVEIDGTARDNSFRSLSRLNPYVANAYWSERSTVDYSGRLGIGGSLWKSIFTYRLYAQISVCDNNPYWYMDLAERGTLMPYLARQTVTSLHGSIELRPVSQLLVRLGVQGQFFGKSPKMPFKDKTFKLADGLSALLADASVRYEGRKISFGVGVDMATSREYTLLDLQREGVPAARLWKTPFAANLKAHFDWHISHRIGLFAEGENLANCRLYTYPWYRDYGAMFTLGVKMKF